MKRIYTAFAVVGLCAASASAFTPQVTASEKVFTTAQKIEGKQFQGNLEVTPLANSGISTRATITAEDVAGYYLFQSHWRDKMGIGGFLIDIAADGKSATISDMLYYPTNVANLQYESAVFNATFDAATGVFSIPNQTIGMGQLQFLNEDETSYVTKNVTFAFQNGEFYDTGKVDAMGDPVYEYRDLSTPMQVKFNPENGALLWDRYAVFSLDVYDATTTEAVGYYVVSQLNSGLKTPNKLDNTDWQDWGTASFTDPWFAPAFNNYSLENATWDVKVQKSKSTDGLIRIVNPYGPTAPEYIWSNNMSPCEGGILIDMADKNCVMALPDLGTPSGLYLEGQGMLYPYSEIGLEYYNYLDVEGEEPYTYEELIEAFGTENIGKVEGRNMEIYSCQFGLSMWHGIFDQYGWTEEPISASLILPDDSGVENVMVDANAPVKFFNLQGMEVANPEAGQVVIKKQGSKATKFIAK